MSVNKTRAHLSAKKVLDSETQMMGRSGRVEDFAYLDGGVTVVLIDMHPIDTGDSVVHEHRLVTAYNGRTHTSSIVKTWHEDHER